MNLITISGPPSSGKTSIITKTIESLKSRGINVGVVKFDCLYTDDDKIFLEDCLLKLEDVIDKLPPKRKQVFELCKFKQKSYEEAGEILNVSPSTISDHIVKANQFIRSELVKQVYSA